MRCQWALPALIEVQMPLIPSMGLCCRCRDTFDRTKYWNYGDGLLLWHDTDKCVAWIHLHIYTPCCQQRSSLPLLPSPNLLLIHGSCQCEKYKRTDESKQNTHRRQKHNGAFHNFGCNAVLLCQLLVQLMYNSKSDMLYLDQEAGLLEGVSIVIIQEH